VLGACGCGPLGGESQDIDDLSNKTLKVTHDSVASSGLTVAFDYDDHSQCSVLDSDAFATLNGRSVSLFRGEYQYFPPQGDDGGFDCTHPSVTLAQIPSDLSPPWTIEIGDSSQVVSATFGPGTPNAFDVGPLVDVALSSSRDQLDVPIVRHPGDTTPAYAAATFTASDGQSSVRRGDVYQPYIRILNPIAPGWPAGPIAAQIDVYYYPPDSLVACENAHCSMTAVPDDCDALPGLGAGTPCSSLHTVSATTDLTLQLSCASANGVCD
jgi:hypothetical protein